ncbi:MAG: site-specific integrase [Chloroflexi bacterium]|nr:site-specific integrase [Chloroflexota bacterium]
MAKRRMNHEGSLSLRKDGLWAARISHEGTRISAYGRTKEEARQKLNVLRRKQDQGLPMLTSAISLQEYLAQWLANVKNRVRPSTYEGYEIMVRVHIIPHLGDIKLGKLGPEHISKAWETMLKMGNSASVVEHAHLRLSKALTDAVKRQLIYRNPCQAVSAPKAHKRELHPPDAQEIHCLLKTAKDTDYYEVLHTAFYTGLRRNEALALRWRDVDLNEASISAGRSLYRAKGGQSTYQAPKTAKDRRLVALTPSSVLVLRALRERQGTDGLLMGYEVNEDGLVFRYRNGNPMLPCTISNAFRKLVLRAGLEGYRFHDTRHAHATLMLRQGVHPKIVQERLGHAKVGTTLDIYSHVTPGLQQAAALRFDEGLAASTPEVVAESIFG